MSIAEQPASPSPVESGGSISVDGHPVALADDGSPLVRALAGAALAAALGAAGWAAMVVTTKHSVGLAAIGLGYLSAVVISRFTGGRRGIAYLAAALVSVVIALGVGKYAEFAYLVHDEARRQYGEAGAAYFGYLSGHTWDAFTAHLGDQFSAFYLLWVGLAASVAWRRLGPSLGR